VPAPDRSQSPCSGRCDVETQLIEANTARAHSEKHARAAERAMETLREELEQKLRTTAENGTLRVKLLEETVQRLSCRSQPQTELARLSMEVSRLCQSEAKLRSDLMFAEDRYKRLRRELEQVEGFASGSSLCAPGPDSGVAGGEQIQDHELLAAMIGRAEKAEIELAGVKQSLDALKETMSFSAGAQERGAGALMAASKV
jgi:hypothetical protein